VTTLVRRGTKASSSIWAMALNLEAALDSCDSPGALRECVLALRRSARRALDAELERRLSDRGGDAGDSCAPELSATLDHLSLDDLLEWIDRQRKDAIVDVFHGAWQGRLWCCEGGVIDATSGELKGESAVYRLLAMDAGEVVVDFRPVRRQRSVRSSTRELAAEALRRKNECADVDRRLRETQRLFVTLAGSQSQTNADGLEETPFSLVASRARAAAAAGGALEGVQALKSAAVLPEPQSPVPIDSTPPRFASEEAPARPLPPPIRARKPAAEVAHRVRLVRSLAGLALAVTMGAAAWMARREAEPEIPIYAVPSPPPDTTWSAAPVEQAKAIPPVERSKVIPRIEPAKVDPVEQPKVMPVELEATADDDAHPPEDEPAPADGAETPSSPAASAEPPEPERASSRKTLESGPRTRKPAAAHHAPASTRPVRRRIREPARAPEAGERRQRDPARSPRRLKHRIAGHDFAIRRRPWPNQGAADEEPSGRGLDRHHLVQGAGATLCARERHVGERAHRLTSAAAPKRDGEGSSSPFT
jgi:hypothetical protein